MGMKKWACEDAAVHQPCSAFLSHQENSASDLFLLHIWHQQHLRAGHR
jgi:hypothetical protein